ncbi:MAG: tRNA uridine-5-carboxymethylaminomethyl(34) synthesis GTPase MnmE [Clostridiales bacterium]|nr:tRNA uridine-5-carboxymethylaminomethyl(34) synthesis GTPase MnmE [Clostridiales bacterium]
MINDNISAIATAPGTGGVAIIRISGSSPLTVLEKMFIPVGKTPVKSFAPNYMYPGKIVAEGFEDFGMCVYFKAPKSFTGEDVVEIHCHGGVQIARGILKKTFALGARSAERGEFTKRAFLNGKLSLSSAEGMIDMINAESLAEIRAGSQLYQEKLTNSVKEIQSELTDILAGIAADIDYPEEGIEETELFDTKQKLQNIFASLSALKNAYSCGKKIKQGVLVAICGKPNTGKSSLLNALLGYDKAIVSSVAGTTRDAVEGVIEIDGVKFNLSDTAGIREKAGEIESVGIEIAKKILYSADLVLFVTEGENGKEEQEILSSIQDRPLIKVFNKSDKLKPHGEYDIAISAKTGEGVQELKKLLAQKSLGQLSLDKAFVIEERHYFALCRATQSIQNAINGVGIYPLDLVSLDIKNSWEALGEITGETANEEIISTVFAKFCVGK